uniref:twin-arginine translocation signal domain-containing protein n=1 Tax=Aeromonas caviae TaxID=648 RepID=UPI0025B71D69
MTFFNDQQTNLSRRTLLKGLGACAALPLLAGIFPKSALAKAVSTALEQLPTLLPAQKGILNRCHWRTSEAIRPEGPQWRG